MLAGQCLTPVGVSFVLLVAIASSVSHAQVNLPMLPVSSRGGQGARWPVPDSSRSEFCAFGGHCQQ